ncbi:hypothetical protein QN346_16925 [Undibacterium sp. 5I1]|nr:hypothetical protein [Undibacterium sp. 5I1]
MGKSDFAWFESMQESGSETDLFKQMTSLSLSSLVRGGDEGGD